MHKLILASASPRRKDLLEMLDFPFSILPADIDESIDSTLPLEEAIEQLAYQKAKSIQSLHPNAIVLGADTIVCIEQEVLGKPRDKEHAYAMLEKLSGKTHQVITGVAIISNDCTEVFHNVSEVTFYDLTKDDILSYLNTGESLDKAGAYAIQGKGAFLVAKIHGDYYNIVGLPVAKVYRKLKPFL